MNKMLIAIFISILSSTVVLASQSDKNLDLKKLSIYQFIFDSPNSRVAIAKELGNKTKKIAFYVRAARTNSLLESDTVTLHCNGTVYKIQADETVICERSPNSTGFFEVENADFRNGSEGTIQEIK